MFGESALPVVVLLLASAIAAFTDVWRFKVYNILTFPLLASGLGYHAIVGGPEQFLSGLIGAMFGFVLFVLPYLFGALGAGDVKFMIAIGAWLGVPAIVTVTLAGCIATGVYSVGVMVYYGQVGDTWKKVVTLFFRMTSTWRLFCHSTHVAVLEDARENAGESVQELAREADRRRRLIPFSAMMTVGLVMTLFWRAWQ